jgi:competence ComEA-like helix-hairpin-helix protein
MPTANDVQIRTIKNAGIVAFLFAVTFSLIFYVKQLDYKTEFDIAVSETVNPNTASAPSLVRLPGIGPERARAIIQYRNTKGNDAFENIDDLQNVKGIGPKISKQLEQWLYFENEN